MDDEGTHYGKCTHYGKYREETAVGNEIPKTADMVSVAKNTASIAKTLTLSIRQALPRKGSMLKKGK